MNQALDTQTLEGITHDAEEKSLPAAEQANQFLTQAEGFKVVTQGDADEASMIAKKLTDRAKKLDDERKAITKPLDEAKKRTMALFKPPIETLNKATDIMRRKVTDYQLEQERKAREAQAKLDEQARKERERLEKRAEAAADKGHAEKAEALREEAETAVIQQQAVTPKTSGASLRKTWVGEVTDVKFLAAAVASGQVPPSFFKVDQSAVDGFARGTKGEVDVPGVKFYEKATTSFR